VNFTVGEVTSPEPFDLREWIYTREGIIVIMVMASIIAILANVAVHRRRLRRRANV
jgi:hypothetical protein